MTINETIKYAEKVAEEQEKLCKRYPNAVGYTHWLEYAEKHRQLAEWLNELKRLREQTRWIPVNQPPKASGRYIVTMHFFDNDFVEMANYSTDLHTVDKYDFPKHKAGWYNDDSEYGHYELDDIVAWMPRPEPYKASSIEAESEVE